MQLIRDMLTIRMLKHQKNLITCLLQTILTFLYLRGTNRHFWTRQTSMKNLLPTKKNIVISWATWSMKDLITKRIRMIQRGKWKAWRDIPEINNSITLKSIPKHLILSVKLKSHLQNNWAMDRQVVPIYYKIPTNTGVLEMKLTNTERSNKSVKAIPKIDCNFQICTTKMSRWLTRKTKFNLLILIWAFTAKRASQGMLAWRQWTPQATKGWNG